MSACLLQLFDLLRDMVLRQGGLPDTQVIGEPDHPGRIKLRYTFLNIPVCKMALASLMGVGWYPRLSGLLAAVFDGKRAPPLDRRFIKRPRTVVSSQRAEVHSYLQTLYESVAEPMPHDADSSHEDSAAEDVYTKPLWSPSVAEVATGCDERGIGLRYLPPGTIFEHWRQYTAVHGKVGFKLFWNVWCEDYKHLLAFRNTGMHSICAVCVKHKLLLRELVNDMRARVKQRLLYDRHLAMQYMDRQSYWRMRASSRIRQTIITLILDGMDQAKFMWPRSGAFSSHAFDFYVRPRLHILGAIVHGHFCLLTVGHADIHKGGSTTVETLSWIVNKLVQLRVPVEDMHLNIQLDNTSGANKNNTVLSWAAMATASNMVGSCSISFLRAGHTHEDCLDHVSS